VTPIKVDPAQLQALGGELARICADLRAARDALKSAAAGAEPATGGSGAPEAYGEMWTAWERDLTILAEALCDLGQRVVAAGGRYDRTEDRAGRSFAAVPPKAR
jgi:uncharacterized protein YukE